jgi:hypothetical protein
MIPPESSPLSNFRGALKSIAQVLASYGLLDAISKSKQEALLRAIYQILEAVEE